MKKLFALTGLVALFGASLVGCSNTAEGAKEDAQNAATTVDHGAKKAANAVDNAATDAGKAIDNAATKVGDAATDAGKNVTGALEVTPLVKNAIVADASLNDTTNKIDVDTADGVVHLKGHVTSNDLKKKATTIAEKALADNKSTDKVSNELTVEKH